jgi:hypothetical protein
LVGPLQTNVAGVVLDHFIPVTKGARAFLVGGSIEDYLVRSL